MDKNSSCFKYSRPLLSNTSSLKKWIWNSTQRGNQTMGRLKNISNSGILFIHTKFIRLCMSVVYSFVWTIFQPNWCIGLERKPCPIQNDIKILCARRRGRLRPTWKQTVWREARDMYDDLRAKATDWGQWRSLTASNGVGSGNSNDNFNKFQSNLDFTIEIDRFLYLTCSCMEYLEYMYSLNQNMLNDLKFSHFWNKKNLVK